VSQIEFDDVRKRFALDEFVYSFAWTQTTNGVLPLTPGTEIEVNNPVSPAGIVKDWPRVPRAYQEEVPGLEIVPAFAGLSRNNSEASKKRITPKRFTGLNFFTRKLYRRGTYTFKNSEWVLRDSNYISFIGHIWIQLILIHNPYLGWGLTFTRY
jgi:hypothetical protein